MKRNRCRVHSIRFFPLNRQRWHRQRAPVFWCLESAPEIHSIHDVDHRECIAEHKRLHVSLFYLWRKKPVFEHRYLLRSFKCLSVLHKPRFPIQHLAASKSGVFIMNCRFLTSYVAVVRIPNAFDPCDTSVNAKHPWIVPFSAASAYFINRSVPMVRNTPGNIFVLKLAFIVKLGS